jgi:hypothetical protein
LENPESFRKIRNVWHLWEWHTVGSTTVPRYEYQCEQLSASHIVTLSRRKIGIQPHKDWCLHQRHISLINMKDTYSKIHWISFQWDISTADRNSNLVTFGKWTKCERLLTHCCVSSPVSFDRGKLTSKKKKFVLKWNWMNALLTNIQ